MNLRGPTRLEQRRTRTLRAHQEHAVEYRALHLKSTEIVFGRMGAVVEITRSPRRKVSRRLREVQQR